MSSNSYQAKTSASSPASFSYFPPASAAYAILRNESGVSVDYTTDAGATVTALASGGIKIITISANTSEVGVRRTDQTATSVNVFLGYGFTEEDIDVIVSQPTPAAAAAVAAHNADAGAHGFGVYTVAQLAAFTNANRPTGCVYCSDCLTPVGVGSPVMWSGSAWGAAPYDIVATTDELTYCREMRRVGWEVATEKQFSFNNKPNRFGSSYNMVGGSGAGISPGGDQCTLLYQTGTTTTGFATTAPYQFTLQLLGRSSYAVRAANTLAYYAVDISVSALSALDEEYAIAAGWIDSAMNTGLSTAFLGAVNDRGNLLGIGNTDNSAEWFAVARASSVNSINPSGVAPGVGRDNTQRLEVILNAAGARFFLGGVQIGNPITTNIPTGNSSLQPRLFIAKSSGTSPRTASVACEYSLSRF